MSDETEHSAPDTPVKTGRREDEIEVTEAMIEAGLDHIFHFSHERGNEEEVVAEIYRAMVKAARH